MILELDCGNSFIKWRVLEANARSVVGEGVVDSDLALLDDLKTLKGLALKFCRLVSVRTADETSELTALLKASFNVSAVCAVPAREMSGVRNGYEDFERNPPKCPPSLATKSAVTAVPKSRTRHAPAAR